MGLEICLVKEEYCRYLYNYDKKVAFNSGAKSGRPFIGILICVNYKNYFAPLTSPKQKHLKMKEGQDFIKIKKGELGGINLNNMIPIPESCLIKINIKEIADIKYRELLKEQKEWCNSNIRLILKKSVNLYRSIVFNNATDKLKERCCDFKLLEEKCYEYMNANSLKEEEVIYKYA